MPAPDPVPTTPQAEEEQPDQSGIVSSLLKFAF
jgi:hypothetical protein